jgi:hypothetical protein
MGERVTQAEAARRLGVSRQAIHAKTQRGTLSLVDGLVDVDEAAAVMVATGRRGRDGVPPDAVAEYVEWRALREHYEALAAQLRYGVLIGEMVEAATVTREVAAAVVNMRLALEAIPDKLAARLFAAPDPAAAAALLATEIGEILEHLRLELAPVGVPIKAKAGA